MADLFNIQSLIDKERIVKVQDVNPSETYVQVGVFQRNGTQRGASNPDTYPSYVMPIDQFLGAAMAIQNKNFIGVDPVWGDDAKAIADGLYNPNSAFLSFDAAVANAAIGDTILMYPGTHTTIGVVNPVCNFFAFSGATLTRNIFFLPTPTALFDISSGTFTLEGDLIINSDVLIFDISGTDTVANIKCKSLTFTGSFYGVAYVTSATMTLTCDEITATRNFLGGIAFTVDLGGDLIVNANILNYSLFGYVVGQDSTLIANVAKNIQYDFTIDVSGLGNSCVLIANGATNATAKINGDLYDAKILPPVSPSGAALNFQSGSSGIIILNGHQSYVSQFFAARIASCPGAQIIINSEMINTYVDMVGGPLGLGAFLDSGILKLRNRFSNKTAPGPSNPPLIQYDGGTLILDGAVLIPSLGVDSIAAVAPITYKCYTGFTPNAPNINATNAIIGTTLIVDPLIE